MLPRQGAPEALGLGSSAGNAALAKMIRIFGVAFLTGFSGAMMPGPLLALTMGQVAATGFAAALWLISGHALLELLLLLLLICGLRSLLEREKTRGFIGLIGGAALLYMGLDMIRHAGLVELRAAATEALSPGYLLLAGAAVSLANPYFTGWWATVGVGQLAHTAPRTRREYAAFYLGHEASDYVWYAFVAALIVTARRWLEGNWYHWLVALCGAAVTLLAIGFLIQGGRLLWRKGAPDEADIKTHACAANPEPEAAASQPLASFGAQEASGRWVKRNTADELFSQGRQEE